MSGLDDVETGRKSHKAPYTPHNTIPTVQKYREEKEEREAKYGTPDGDQDERSKLERIGDAYTLGLVGFWICDSKKESLRSPGLVLGILVMVREGE